MAAGATPYDRIRRLLKARPGHKFTIALVVVEVVLAIALLLVAGLLFALLATRGVTHLTGPSLSNAPSWLRGRVPLEAMARASDLWLGDTGLTPVVVANLRREAPMHARLAASVLQGVVGGFRPLQGNISALVTLLTVALALLLGFVLVLQWRRSRIIASAAETATSLRKQVHRQMYRLGLSALPNEGIGPVVDLFTREVNDVRDGLIADLEGSVRVPLLAAGLMLVALVLSWPLAAFLFALFCLTFLIFRPLKRGARVEADAAARASALQLCLLHEDLGLVRLVRVFGMESHDKDRFDEHLERYEEADVRRLQSEGSVRPTQALLLGIATVIGLGLLGWVVLRGETWGLSLPAGLVLVLALLGVLRQVDRWEALRLALRQANRSAGSIFAYLDRKPDLLMVPEAQFLSPLKSRIAFEDVSLTGSTGRAILSGVNAAIPAGTRTAILGLDEDAKQALACLVPRLIDPSGGQVRIDGRDLREVTLESLRAQVATIFQADLVFSDSVLANIGLGDPSYGLPKIIEAAKFAHAHHFIQDLPDGYDTLIGPLGHPLQPDEMYRIALARAFLHDPSILIIEEPTNPLSDEIKPVIDDTVDRLAQKRTLIFLPHRLSTIRKCDQVLVLHNGRLEVVGQPRELSKKSKLYRHIQYMEFNQFATGEIEAGEMDA